MEVYWQLLWEGGMEMVWQALMIKAIGSTHLITEMLDSWGRGPLDFHLKCRC